MKQGGCSNESNNEKGTQCIYLYMSILISSGIGFVSAAYSNKHFIYAFYNR